ncbi:MAG: right-handed parallel beta-helix repeat-containing protein, partial [Gorillibacterium sp.]|nr:right-handed parallel beta-helix repeat-containing protein [Gorillibacterium sp.]
STSSGYGYFDDLLVSEAEPNNEHISNNGFSSGLTGWNTWGAASVSSGVLQAQKNSGVFQIITSGFEIGRTYQFYGSGKLSTTAIAGEVWLELMARDSSGNAIKSVKEYFTTDQYVEKGVEMTVPKNTADLVVYVYYTGTSAGTGTGYFDNLEFKFSRSIVPVPSSIIKPTLSAGIYYVDPNDGRDNYSGTSQSQAWQTLGKVSGYTLSPGTQILLKRGATYSGSFSPAGSGINGNPLKLSAYGTGNRPIIQAGTGVFSAIQLYNQEYWIIENVEISGGKLAGIYIWGNQRTVILDYFRITNVYVHDVGDNTAYQGKDIGGIIFTTYAHDNQFKDVIIDGATVVRSKRWSGIFIKGSHATYTRSDGIIVRNSRVEDTFADGIALFSTSNSIAENNVVIKAGGYPNDVNGNANGIWCWNSVNCKVQFNEVSETNSSTIDGGSFDIDWNNQDSVVQYNYGHDSHGYGVAVMGAEKFVTSNAIVRYNIFSNNGRESAYAYQGDFLLNSWSGGSINGVKIYNNTSYWNPASEHAALMDRESYIEAVYSGTGERLFKNNIIYSTSKKLIDIQNKLALNNNLYWYTGGYTPEWKYNGIAYSGFSNYKGGSGQDANGFYQEPNMNAPTYHSLGVPTTQFNLNIGSPAINTGTNIGSMGTRDFFGNTIPKNGIYDIGAQEK